MELLKQLSTALNQSLPGTKAQMRMAPYHRSTIPDARLPSPRQSAVLMLLEEYQQEPVLIFIKRPNYQGVHSNQIAFPGGKYELSDHSLQHTAQRETNEEIGVSSTAYNVLGQLTKLYIPPSNFWVQPFLAYANKPLSFSPEQREVAAVLRIPIRIFTDAKHVQYKRISTQNNAVIKAPCYVFQDELIWGATAMLVSELVSILNASH